MKTNHQRGFKDNPGRTDPGKCSSARVCLDGTIVQSFYIGHNFTDGHRGESRCRHGAKKFVNSRARFRDKAALKKLVEEIEDGAKS